MYSTPTSKLEAVNLMLSVIGEAPVNSVTGSDLGDANLAYQILSYASREVQLVGWHWNTEPNYPITPNQEGSLVLPSNTLRVDTSGDSKSMDLVQRGLRLYDRENHTFTFTSPVTVDICFNLPFTDLPESARNYITIRAARQFEDRTLGSSTRYTPQDENSAFVVLRHDEAESSDCNMLTGSWSVARILQRS